MRIISRYILREALLFFSISLAVFTGVLLTIRMLRFAALVVNKGVDPGQIAIVFLAIVPAFLEIALPLATLLGLMLAFGRMSGDSEIIVLRASGISIGQLIKPVIIFGVLMAGMATYVTNSLSPWGFQILSKTLFEIAKSRSTAGLNDGVFNRLGNMILYLDHIDQSTGAMTKVIVDDRRNPEQRKVIIAKSGEVLSDSDLKTITLRLFDGNIHEIIDGKYVLTRFDSNSVILDPNEVLDADAQSKGKSPKEMSLRELWSESDRYESLLKEIRSLPEGNPQMLSELSQNLGFKEVLGKQQVKRKVRRLEVEIQRRFSMPYASFVLALLALPLGIYPPRSQKTWGAGLSAVFGLGVFLIYYALLSIGMAFAENGILPALLGLWIPNIVATLLAIHFLRKIASERWQSILQGFDGIAYNIKTFALRLANS